ncbi:MAG: hypothetical protein IKB16_04310 [Lentisphaeria bacterium]|nr:hypothetical protein [Lentisphaeria bacterium]
MNIKPDFERDILSAAEFDGIRHASRFSWSYARETLFRRCKRAYFIRYYLAQGGWDMYANPLIRSAYIEKYRIPFHIWLAKTFHLAMQSAFRQAAVQPIDKRKKVFTAACLRYLGRAVTDLQFSLENREYVDDPKKPAILEFLRAPDQSAALLDMKQRAVDSFSSAYGTFIKSEIFASILSLNFTALRLDDPFLSFQFEQWPVWFAPGIVWYDKGQFHSLLAQAWDPEGEDGIGSRVTAALLDLYVQSKWNFRKTTSSVFVFHETGGFFSPLEPEAAIRSLIRESSTEMLALIGEDGNVNCRDFPCTSSESYCENCQFKGTCKALCNWEKTH